MSHIAWDPAVYGVGISAIDEQHHQLVNYVNAFDDAIREGRGREALGKTLSNVINYTETHFRFEEELMRSAGYEDYEAHKKSHEDFVDRIKEIHFRFHCGESALTEATMTLIKDWVYFHIGGSDRKYAKAISEKASHLQHLFDKGAK